MWVAAIDIQMAFDPTQHDAIWRSLRNRSVSEQYICLLKELYADQRSIVLKNMKNDEFGIACGRQQGEPLSCFLFNTVLQSSNGERHWDLE